MIRAGGGSLRILHVSHTSLVSGGEHSLLDLLAGERGRAAPQLVAPDGPLLERAAALGIETIAVRAIDLTFKGDPRTTAAGLRDAGVVAAQLAARPRSKSYDVIHANSVRAGLYAGPVAHARRVPLVVHVRDVLPDSRPGFAVRRATTAMASRVVAISRHVAHAYADGLPRREAQKVVVADNPIDLERFVPADEAARRRARSELGIDDDRPILAIIGQITSWKGHDTAVRTLAAVRDAHPDAMLLVVGEVKFVSAATTLDNASFRRRLDDLRVSLGVPSDAVRYMGERDDVPAVLAATDLLLAPSKVEPFGRSIAEAMAVGVPVIATSRGGPAEFIEDAGTGWLMDPEDANEWGARATSAMSDRQGTAAIAHAGQTAVRARFSVSRHADVLLEIFGDAACGR